MRFISIAILSLMCFGHAMAEGQVTWLSKVHDFGAFDEDTKVKTATFKFVNTCDEPVSIISATATCGCTVPTYSDKPVEPGDTAVITVSYDPSGRPGRFEKQIYVRTSDNLDRTKLVIKGAVIGNPVTINGRYPVSMGALKLRTGAAMMGKAYAGHEKIAYVDGYNMSRDSISPVVVSVPAYIEPRIFPTTTGPGEMLSIDLTFKGDRCDQWGILTDSLVISPDGGAQTYALPIIVIVEEDFSGLTPQQLKDAPVAKLADDRLNISPVPEGSVKPVSATIKLANKGIDDLKIRRVYSEDLGITVDVNKDVVQKNKSADIRVTFDPSVQPTGIINARVNVITNDPANPTQTLRIVGERN